MHVDTNRPVPKGLELLPAYFSGTIVRVSASTLWISGEQSGGFLGTGFTGISTYLTRSADPDFSVFEDALNGQESVNVSKFRVA